MIFGAGVVALGFGRLSWPCYEAGGDDAAGTTATTRLPILYAFQFLCKAGLELIFMRAIGLFLQIGGPILSLYEGS